MCPTNRELTFAEARVLFLLLRGANPSDVAGQLDVKISTVRAQIRSLHSKSGTHSLLELASWATQNLENGVLTPLLHDPKWAAKLDEFLT